MRAYLLCHNDYNTLHLVVASGAVEAAKKLCDHLGCPPYQKEDTATGRKETNISVQGSFSTRDGVIVDVSKWWPHFSCNPRAVKPVPKDERKAGR